MKFTNKIRACVIILTLSLICFPLPTWAVTVGSVPNARQTNGTYVTDMANILSSDTERKINRQIAELEAKNGSEIAVVTVTDTSPSITPKKFATSLFNRWRIGKKGVNNGVLFLISLNERQVEIETGNGAREVLPDRSVAEIIQQEILPKFKQGDFDGGTLTGTKALISKLNSSTTPTKIDNTFGKNIWIFALLGFAIIGLFLAICDVINVKKHGKLNQNQNGDNAQIYTWYGCGSSGWSSGSSGNFGGGSSSGGGGGGGW